MNPFHFQLSPICDTCDKPLLTSFIFRWNGANYERTCIVNGVPAPASLFCQGHPTHTPEAGTLDKPHLQEVPQVFYDAFNEEQQA